jgi:hypothetical protein
LNCGLRVFPPGRQNQLCSFPIGPKITSLPARKILSGGVEKLDQPVVVLGEGFVAAEITECIREKDLAEVHKHKGKEKLTIEPDFNLSAMGDSKKSRTSSSSPESSFSFNKN